MDRKILKDLVEVGLSTREIGKKVSLSQTSVVYWLKKYNMKSACNYYLKNKDNKYCPRCKTKKGKESFYKRRGVEGGSGYCKTCTNDQTIERMRHTKKLCIEYKGGKCQKCEYDKYDGALEFHHLDPSQKDFDISRKKAKHIDNIKGELDKCILVCANCHREIHGGIAQLDLEQETSNF